MHPRIVLLGHFIVFVQLPKGPHKKPFCIIVPYRTSYLCPIKAQNIYFTHHWNKDRYKHDQVFQNGRKEKANFCERPFSWRRFQPKNTVLLTRQTKSFFFFGKERERKVIITGDGFENDTIPDHHQERITNLFLLFNE